MTYLLFALILIFALAGAGGEIYFNSKKKKANDFDTWNRYHKYATWCKVLGIGFSLATGFLGSQLFLK